MVGRIVVDQRCRQEPTIKAVTRSLPLDWGSKAESALRIFADRALLLIESVAVAKLLMLGIAYPFRRRWTNLKKN